jgi:hypothetical protein
MPRNIKLPRKLSDEKELKADGPLQALITKTPAQGAQWIEDNVNNLAEAKQALKFLVKAVIALSHRI